MPPIRNKKRSYRYNLRPRQHRVTNDPDVPVVRGSSPEEPARPDTGVSIPIESNSQNHQKAAMTPQELDKAIREILILPFTCILCGTSMGHGILFAGCECVSGYPEAERLR